MPLDELTPAERKVARTLLARYPAAGLESTAALAAAAGTGKPTVLRLLARLGFGGYPDFQERLRAEVTIHEREPAEPGPGPAGGTVRRQRLPPRGRTAFPARHATAGHRAAGRNRTSRFTACRTPEACRHIRRILLAVDRPHAAKEVVSTAKTYGASVILITDESLSPSAEEADIVLPVAVDGIPFDSLAALLVLTESLVAAVFHGVGDGAIERMADWERSVRIHRVGHSLSRP